MIELSIIIPCYLKNEELLQLTKNTIHSFREADLPEYELILIDDGSSMGGGYLRREADTYILHQNNKGFMKSVNDGLKVARGDYIAVANNDIRVAPNFFVVAKEILKSSAGIYSVHPRMLFYNDEIEYGNSTYVTGYERWCQTSFFIVRSDNLVFFPEHFKGTGGAYEDWFYWSCIRRNRDLRTVYTTKTCFQHKDSSTTQIVGEQSKHHKENRELFKEEFGDYPEDYYSKLYPDQMKKGWRKEFTKL